MEGVVGEREDYTLVVRKPCFGLPTACPSCLPVYFYLKFSHLTFNLDFNLMYPDSDKIPYVESGDYAAYNNEKGGVIERLKGDGIVDLDTELYSVPEWISFGAMISTWLADALLYELWVGSDGSSAEKIYCSDLPWPIGKMLFFKQIFKVKEQLGITKDNAEQKEEEIYRKANIAYGALSTKLGEQKFFFESRPSSLDAIFLGQTLITLQALPETSVLRSKLLEHDNLVKYAERMKIELIHASSSSSVPHFHAESSSSAPRRGPSKWSSKPKSKPKREKTKEAAKAENRGVCYLSRIPPHMNHLQLRHILSQYGDIQRIYLTPGRENAAAQVRRKRKEFLEGWVEFSDKRVAKRVANMLNGEEIGGKKRSSFYYDIWNIKYLSKFKWDDLTEEIAYKSAIREQKMALEISAAKKERDFYLSKVDKSRALSAIEERLKKKQKQQQDSGTNPDLPVIQQVSKVVRQFPQTQPIADTAAESKPRLSKDILSGVFGGLQ